MFLRLTTLLSLFFATSIAGPITFSPENDGRNWREAYSGKVDSFTIIEYTSGDEHLTKWTRLATILKHKGIEQDPAQVFESLVQSMKSGNPGMDVTSKVIDSEENSTTGEWTLKSKDNSGEYNIVRIFNENGNIYTLLYTTKNLKDVESDRISWGKILKNAKVKE